MTHDPSGDDGAPRRAGVSRRGAGDHPGRLRRPPAARPARRRSAARPRTPSAPDWRSDGGLLARVDGRARRRPAARPGRRRRVPAPLRGASAAAAGTGSPARWCRRPSRPASATHDWPSSRARSCPRPSTSGAAGLRADRPALAVRRAGACAAHRPRGARPPTTCGRSGRGSPATCGPATSSCSPVTSGPARPRSPRASGAALGVEGAVTSPTFVIAREHPSASAAGPELVHVDAYRLGGTAELDDLDLDTSFDDAVTVVEWGEGLAEGLADSRLEIRITRTPGTPPDAELDPEPWRSSGWDRAGRPPGRSPRVTGPRHSPPASSWPARGLESVPCC